MHEKELKRTTNTGRLATKCLLNSELRVRGTKSGPLDLSDLLEMPYEPLLLYPSEDARDLNTLFTQIRRKPVLLIVPDGNWRQASKVHTRHKELAHVPRVFLKKKATDSSLVMRKETVENGMATLEAIAAAFGTLENSAVGAALKQLYELKLHQTLLGRGQTPQSSKNF